MTGETIEMIVRPVTIAGNPLRQQLILTASPTNENIIWLGVEEHTGTPLSPNEKITLDTDQPINVLGSAGDQLYVAELVTVPPVSRPTEEM